MTFISFLDTRLSLIHAPTHLFNHFFHAILSLLTHPPLFFNISITPTSLSVICPSLLADTLFRPIIEQLHDEESRIEEGEYVAAQVDGSGMGDGSQLLTLTKPLARAGVSILFITTYFSDYLLVSERDAERVKRALLRSDFFFEDGSDTYISSAEVIASPREGVGAGAIGGKKSGMYSPEEIQASFAPEFQLEFSHSNLKHDEEIPDPEMQAIVKDDSSTQTGSMDPTSSHHPLQQHPSYANTLKVPVHRSKASLLMTGSSTDLNALIPQLTTLLLTQPLPAFFSITLAPNTRPSMLLTLSSVPIFEKSGLLGVEGGPVLVPIVLDLRDCPGSTKTRSQQIHQDNTNGNGIMDEKGIGKVGGPGLGGCGIVCGAVEELLLRTRNRNRNRPLDLDHKHKHTHTGGHGRVEGYGFYGEPEGESSGSSEGEDDFVMSYLSTVVTGNVLIREDDIESLTLYGEECRIS